MILGFLISGFVAALSLAAIGGIAGVLLVRGMAKKLKQLPPE
jgi:hypothetical protein